MRRIPNFVVVAVPLLGLALLFYHLTPPDQIAGIFPSLFVASAQLLIGYVIAIFIFERRQRTEVRQRLVFAYIDHISAANTFSNTAMNLYPQGSPEYRILGSNQDPNIVISEATINAVKLGDELRKFMTIFESDTSSELKLGLTSILEAHKDIAIIPQTGDLNFRVRAFLCAAKKIVNGVALVYQQLGISSDDYLRKAELEILDTRLKSWETQSKLSSARDSDKV